MYRSSSRARTRTRAHGGGDHPALSLLHRLGGHPHRDGERPAQPHRCTWADAPDHAHHHDDRTAQYRPQLRLYVRCVRRPCLWRSRCRTGSGAQLLCQSRPQHRRHTAHGAVPPLSRLFTSAAPFARNMAGTACHLRPHRADGILRAEHLRRGRPFDGGVRDDGARGASGGDELHHHRLHAATLCLHGDYDSRRL